MDDSPPRLNRFPSARRLLALGACLWLAACATHPPHKGPTHPVVPREQHRPEFSIVPPLPPVPVASLPGWADEDHLGALKAYRATCFIAQDPRDHDACAAAKALRNPDAAAARTFFETRFEARPQGEPGLLTGYFAPEYEARDEPDEEFSAPVRPRPPELARGADGRWTPWLTRAEIEKSPARALAFMRPEDLFFMQIQGSGYLQYPDGRRARAAYSADNGRPFTGIARPMAEKGLLPRSGTSGEAIRAWLADHRGEAAEAITDLDERYVFFNVEPDDGGDPKGAAGVPLVSGRTGAVDTVRHGFGELLWIEADSPILTGGAANYRRLITALDSGGAIKGPVRVDLYLGRGDEAGREAGRIRHPLKLWRLTPKS